MMRRYVGDGYSRSMKHEIQLESRTIEYTVKKNGQSKCLRISVRHTGEVVVTIPRRVAWKQAIVFVEQKSAWITRQLDALRTTVPALSEHEHRAAFLQRKEAARKFVLERIAYLNAPHQWAFNRVTIKNHSTKWGSCSSKGNLNFNSKIILLPPEIADYIIVHELCHLREMNHSSRFWQLVEQVIPDYALRRRALRRIEKNIL